MSRTVTPPPSRRRGGGLWLPITIALIVIALLVGYAAIAAIQPKVSPEASTSASPSDPASASPTPSAAPTSVTPSPTPTVTTSSEPAQDEADEQTDEEKEIAELIEALSVKTDAYVCKTDSNGVIAWKLKTTALRKQLKYGDAVRTPLPKGVKLGDVQKIVCEDPVFGSMVANFFANLGNLADQPGNEPVKEFKGKNWAKLKKLALSYVPFINNPAPSAEEVEEARLRNKEWQVVASTVNTMLAAYKAKGRVTERSVLNYKAERRTGDGVPVIKLNKVQESLPSFALELRGKAGNCISRIAFNYGDGRLEQLSCAKPKTPQVRIPPRSEPPRRTQPPTRPPTTRPPTTQPPTTTRPAKTANPVDGQPEPESHPDPSQSADER